MEEELLELCDVAVLGDVADLLLEGVHHVVDGAETHDRVAVTAPPVRPEMCLYMQGDLSGFTMEIEVLWVVLVRYPTV